MPRCSKALDRCHETPPYFTAEPEHRSACWLGAAAADGN
jgi:hypothetical protein